MSKKADISMIRLANRDDYDKIIPIFKSARKYMIGSGNPNQWTKDYPGPKFLSELESGEVYVFEEYGQIHGVFLLHLGEDPTYSKIDGAWLNDNRPYGTLHRIASDGYLNGVFDLIVEFSLKKIKDLRIDTHEDNKIMQKLILSEGFSYCGIIQLENGDDRLAYQLEYIDGKEAH